MPDDPMLPAELTIYTVGEWRTRCLAWLDAVAPGGGALDLDASAVAEADAAGVQLLTALANALARRDARLVLSRPSATLHEVCQRLGADFLLSEGHGQELTA